MSVYKVHRNLRITCSEEGQVIMTMLLVMGQLLGPECEDSPQQPCPMLPLTAAVSRALGVHG